jgi:hypothetical protein
MMNYSQIYAGFGSRGPAQAGRAAIGTASTPTSINASMTGTLGASSGAPLAGVVLAAIGGLTLLYVATRGIQGSRL